MISSAFVTSMAPDSVAGTRLISAKRPRRLSTPLSALSERNTSTPCLGSRTRLLSSGKSPVLVSMTARGTGLVSSASRLKESLSARMVPPPIMTASALERRVRITLLSLSVPNLDAFPSMAVLPSADCTMLRNTNGLVFPFVMPSRSMMCSWMLLPSFDLGVLSGVTRSVCGIAEGGGVREAYVHADAFRGVLAGMDLGEAVEVACGGVIGVRDEEGHPLPLGGNRCVDALQEVLAVVEGAYRHGVGVLGPQLPDTLFVDEVRLVKTHDGDAGGAGSGSIIRSERLVEGLGDGGDLLPEVYAGG